MSRLRKALLGTAAIGAGALVVSIAATQFVAWRVHYHPALGAPWFGHFYAPWSWLQWQQARWAPNAKATFAIVDSVLLAVASVGMLAGMAISTSRRRRPTRHEGVHGTARFATEKEIRRSGLLPRPGAAPVGVYVGGWTDKRGRVHYLIHTGPEHVIVIAPTRSGKGVGNILPTLLSWPASCLIYDEKGELWQLTAGWRSQHAGNTVIRWEPSATEGSAGFNFLEEIRLGTPHEVSDAQNIALAIIDPSGVGLDNKDHWGKTSFDLLAALFLHVLYTARAKGSVGSLTDVAYALSDPDRDSDALWEEMRTNRHGPCGRLHMYIASEGRKQIDRPEKERGSVLSSAVSYLSLLKDEIVAKNTRRSDFRITDLVNSDRPASLYVVTRGADKVRLRPLVRLLLTMVLRQVMDAELRYVNGQAVSPHKHRLLLGLDEFPSLGRMQIVEDALPMIAAWGVKAFLAAQTREQVFKAYEQYQSITGNCHIRIIYAPNEYQTAKWISDSVGVETVIKEDVTESGTRYGSLKNVSRTYHETGQPLLTPDEIMALKKPVKDDAGWIVESGEMVIFVAGERPIFGTQILYYTDPIFKRRAMIPPPATGSTRARAMAFA